MGKEATIWDYAFKNTIDSLDIVVCDPSMDILRSSRAVSLVALIDIHTFTKVPSSQTRFPLCLPFHSGLS